MIVGEKLALTPAQKEEVWRDTIAILRGARFSSNDSFAEVLMAFSHLELVAIVTIMATMLNHSITVGCEDEGTDPDEVYNLMLSGLDD